jgi:hypothetical protein
MNIKFNEVTRFSQAVAIILFVIVFFVGFFIGKKAGYKDYEDAHPEPVSEQTMVTSGKLNGNPTNFAYDGLIEFDNADLKKPGQKTPYFSYIDDKTKKGTTTKLVFDAMSYCASQGGALPCVEMNVTYDKPFMGRNAVVEGIMQDGQVLVRKLYVLRNNETPKIPGIDQTFITWKQAESFVASCGVKTVKQDHNLDVYFTMTDGTHLRAVEPTLNDVATLVKTAKSTCGDIQLTTE